MTDNQWDKKVTNFLRQTGEELKRAGEQIKSEAQKLLGEIKDPSNQQKLKEKLDELGTWAKKTAEDASELFEAAVKKAEESFNRAAERSPSSPEGIGDEGPDTVGSVPPPIDESPTDRAKTIGRKAGKRVAKEVKHAAKAAKHAAKSAAKSLGRKRR